MIGLSDSSPTPERRIRFLLGTRTATPAALEAIEAAGDGILNIFARHESGDWGVVCDVDSFSNEEAIRDGNRIMSAYILKTGVKIWVITEADRSSTTILLPEEY